MAFLAKYLETDIEVEQLVGAITGVVGRLHETDNAPHGYHGMDHYWSFSVGRLMGQVMVQGGPGQLGVVVFTMPNMMQKGTARELLGHIAAAVPRGEVRPFPGGGGGLLTFV